MTTVAQAYAAVRGRLESNVPTSGGDPIPLRWQNEIGEPLPDIPAPFVYVEFDNDGSVTRGPASFGAGRGDNIYRNEATITAYVFVPTGEGLNEAHAIAEQIAALFRSHRDNDISCFRSTVYPGGQGADIRPPGLDSEVGNYFYAIAEIDLHFDQLG